MPRCAVLGSPIAHSLSPVLHRAAYAALGLAGFEYDAIDVPAGGLGDFLRGLDQSWTGFSLTMPLKREVLTLGSVSALSPVVQRTGAANTLLRTGGSWQAENTDVPGAVAAIRERWSKPIASAAVIGGGATAGSLVVALEQLGCPAVTVLSRDRERSAQALAVSPITTWAPLDGAALDVDLVASTVPAAAQSPTLVNRCAQVPVVFEVVYDPWPTPLAQRAIVDGAVLIGGLDLLVHQAVLQVALMTHTPVEQVPLAAMRAAGQRRLTCG